MTPQGWSTICWNSVLGQCTFGWNCIFHHGHVKPDKISQKFADGVCNVIAKGVLHLWKNNGGTSPLPAKNRKRVASKQATANKWWGKLSQIPRTGMDDGDKMTQKKALLGKLAVEWEHRVASGLNSSIWEPANTPTHHPGDNSKGTSGIHWALWYKEGKKNENLVLHAPLLNNRQGKKILNDGASRIAAEDTMWACNRDNRGKDDVSVLVDMNTRPTMVPFRAWNTTRVENYPSPSLRDENQSDTSTGNMLRAAQMHPHYYWVAQMHPRWVAQMHRAQMRGLGKQPRPRVAQMHLLKCLVTKSLLMAGVPLRRTM